MTDAGSRPRSEGGASGPINPMIADLRARIRQHSPGMARAAQRACRVLAELTPEELLYKSATDLGEASQTSNATVVRTLQALGYEGLADLKALVAGPFTSAIPPAERTRQRLESTGGDLGSIWEKVTVEAAERIELLRRYYSPEAYMHAIELLLDARSVLTYGFGSSMLSAEHLTRKLRRIGFSSGQITGSGFQLADEMLAIGRDDVIVAFVPGRLPPEVQVLLERARTLNAKTILVTHELTERLKGSVTVVIHAPNTPTGLTAEVLNSITVADALVQGLASVDRDRTVQSSYTLTDLRAQLGF